MQPSLGVFACASLEIENFCSNNRKNTVLMQFRQRVGILKDKEILPANFRNINLYLECSFILCCHAAAPAGVTFARLIPATKPAERAACRRWGLGQFFFKTPIWQATNLESARHKLI